MAFRASPNATVIGSTTAGADGNVSFFYLPGGIYTQITGLGVYYPDGTETQQVGIVPDITVTHTIEGIRNGRDECWKGRWKSSPSKSDAWIGDFATFLRGTRSPVLPYKNIL